MAHQHLFIIHSTSDADLARDMRELLEAEGLEIWMDDRDLAPGDDLDPEIRTAIEKASHVVVILSPEALSSARVKKEVDLARSLGSTPGEGPRLISMVRPPFEPSMVSWVLGSDVAAIPLAEAPGSFDEAMAKLLVALGRADLAQEPHHHALESPKPVAELTIRFYQPTFEESGGKRHVAAQAQITYRPADLAEPSITDEPFQFVAPLGTIEADELAWYLERYGAWPSPHFLERARRLEAGLSGWGLRLYEALAHQAALEAWHRDKESLRRLSIFVDSDPEERGDLEGASHLLSLPWELLHDGESYLFQDGAGILFRRQLPKRRRSPPISTEAPVRVLLVSPRPEDDCAAYYDHRASARPLVEAFEPLGEMVELTILRPATFQAMAAELDRARSNGQPYDVVHFDGHGVYDEQLGSGALCFEDPGDVAKLSERRATFVGAEAIADVLRDHRVSLVFLEASQTAAASTSSAPSVAARLLERGVGSVVAMSYSVLIEATRRFLSAFYPSLARGERIGEAMLEGQRTLANDPRRGVGFDGDFHLQDWFVPVLYQKDLDPPLVTSQPDAVVRRLTEKRRELALGSLPVPQHGFVGRSRELLMLERLLESESWAVVLGEGGEGKTTLAAELASWLVRTRRFARAAFVSAESALDLRSLVWALGEQLVPNFLTKVSAEPEKAVPLIERALRERATIVVIDDMESILPPMEGAEDLAAYEPRLLDGLLQLCASWSRDGETRIVFTSREALPEPFALVKNNVKIGRLDRDDAIRLVARVLGEDEERPAGDDAGESEDEVVKLVDAVNRHAHSLVLVAREVAASGVKGATERLEALMARMAEREGDEREESLFASVELSLRRLPEESRRRLPRLGVFRGGGHLGVIAQVLGLDYENDEEVELMRQLVGVGLGEMMPYGHLRLHPALGPLLSRELDEVEREEARRAWVGAMVALARYLYQQQSQDIQLAATLTLLELPNLLGALELLAVSADAEEVVDVATMLEGLLQDLGRPRAMARVVRVREEAAQGLGAGAQGRLVAEGAAVNRLLEAGRLSEAVRAARALLQRALEAGEEAYPVAPYNLANAHWLLGRALKMSGTAEAALEPLGAARKRFQELGDAGDREASRMAMGSLIDAGDCFRDLGRLDDAAAAYGESIRLAEELDDRRGSAVAKGNLGTVRMLQQRYEDALSAFDDARQTFEQLGEPGSVAVAWHQVGMAHQEAGQYEAAEHAYQQALRFKVQRGERSGEASTLNQLGTLSSLMGRAEDAVRFLRQAAAIRSELGDLMSEGRSRSNIALALLQLQRYDEARQEILRAIECKKPYGHAAEPWKTFNVLHDLERAVGNPAAAEDARAQAVAAFLAYRRAGGENHDPGAKLVAFVGQAVTFGEMADAAEQLAQLASRPDLPERVQALVPVLQQILDGERDPALAESAGLYYMDAVEVLLLLEALRPAP